MRKRCKGKDLAIILWYNISPNVRNEVLIKMKDLLEIVKTHVSNNELREDLASLLQFCTDDWKDAKDVLSIK
jgi:hypothetical protein